MLDSAFIYLFILTLMVPAQSKYLKDICLLNHWKKRLVSTVVR